MDPQTHKPARCSIMNRYLRSSSGALFSFALFPGASPGAGAAQEWMRSLRDCRQNSDTSFRLTSFSLPHRLQCRRWDDGLLPCRTSKRVLHLAQMALIFRIVHNHSRYMFFGNSESRD